ncbi:guanine nucleotide-binding protein subunit beta-5b-like [Adelges cooleyi]|uniref:guanine nucleotide-binding protein subunit beta-5b-like n=1 Tax=Adelges cooleyi TaxID=133065 RepID=UPI00217FB46D|nr:guanine nucleotide-binding protein subunit beta-5b-like [Adelges cooleyi]
MAEEPQTITLPTVKVRRMLEELSCKFTCFDWSVDKQHIVSSTESGTLIIWNAYRNKKEKTILMPNNLVLTCAYSPSGNIVACGGSDNKVNVINILSSVESTSSEVHNVGTHLSFVSCCSFPNSDHQILTGSGDASAVLWDIESGQMIQSFHSHVKDILAIDISSSEIGNIFISGGCDKKVLLWDMRAGQSVKSFVGHLADINCVKYHPSGDIIASGSDDGTCRMYDLRADKEIALYSENSIVSCIESIDFSLSGRLFFAGCTGHLIRVWDNLTREKVRVLQKHRNRVTTVKTSPDGTSLASASWDGTLCVWA